MGEYITFGPQGTSNILLKIQVLVEFSTTVIYQKFQFMNNDTCWVNIPLSQHILLFQREKFLSLSLKINSNVKFYVVIKDKRRDVCVPVNCLTLVIL